MEHRRADRARSYEYGTLPATPTRVPSQIQTVFAAVLFAVLAGEIPVKAQNPAQPDEPAPARSWVQLVLPDLRDCYCLHQPL